MTNSSSTKPRLWDLRPEAFYDNQQLLSNTRIPNAEPCFICGRPCNPEKAKLVEITTAGLVIPEGQEHPDSQGAYPIGSTCFKLLKTARTIND